MQIPAVHSTAVSLPLQEKNSLRAVTEMVQSSFRFELTAALENKNLQCFHIHIFSLKSLPQIPPSPFPSEQYQKTVRQPSSILTQTNTAERWLLRVLYFKQHLANLEEERSVILVRLQFTKLEWHQVVSG